MPKFSKFFKGLGIVVLIILILLVCAVLWLTIREYRPEKEEALKVPKNTRTLSLDDSLRIMTYNIGYAGLALYKKQMLEQTPYVVLVDAGDAIQGAPIGTLSDGG